MDLYQRLVEGIYEAAFLPEAWTAPLSLAKEAVSADSAAILIYDDIRPVGYRAIGPIAEVAEQFITGGSWRVNGRIAHFYQHPFTGFVTDVEYFGEDFLRAERGLEKREALGFHSQIGTMIALAERDVAVFAFDRIQGAEGFGAQERALLDALYPHLARASLMSARLNLERARSTTSALQTVGLPACVLTRRATVLAANALFEGLSTLFLPTAFGGLAIAHPEANHLFRHAVEAFSQQRHPVVQSIPIRATEKHGPLVLHLLPLRRSSQDVFSGGDLLLAVTAIDKRQAAPAPSILSGLFDLAPSEARLAAALTKGQSLRAYAEANGITFATARKYLDRIFEKTGTGRQSDLVALLKGASPLA